MCAFYDFADLIIQHDRTNQSGQLQTTYTIDGTDTKLVLQQDKRPQKHSVNDFYLFDLDQMEKHLHVDLYEINAKAIESRNKFVAMSEHIKSLRQKTLTRSKLLYGVVFDGKYDSYNLYGISKPIKDASSLHKGNKFMVKTSAIAAHCFRFDNNRIIHTHAECRYKYRRSDLTAHYTLYGVALCSMFFVLGQFDLKYAIAMLLIGTLGSMEFSKQFLQSEFFAKTECKDLVPLMSEVILRLHDSDIMFLVQEKDLVPNSNMSIAA